MAEFNEDNNEVLKSLSKSDSFMRARVDFDPENDEPPKTEREDDPDDRRAANKKKLVAMALIFLVAYGFLLGRATVERAGNSNPPLPAALAEEGR